jgi:putative transposase
MKRFKDHKHYRIPGFDYTSPGSYFITISVKNKEKDLGKIINEKMELSVIGKVANALWKKIPQKYPNALLDEFQIMPDHIHGIITLVKHEEEKDLSSSHEGNKIGSNLHPILKNSISSIINHFKGNVKKWCNNNGYSYFCWQSRFNDKVIRNEIELNNIRRYIQDNPKKWKNEKQI